MEIVDRLHKLCHLTGRNTHVGIALTVFNMKIRTVNIRRSSWPPMNKVAGVRLSDITTKPETVSSEDIAKVREQLARAKRVLL